MMQANVSLSVLKIDVLLTVYEVSEEDINAVLSLGEALGPHIDEFIERFYKWLVKLEEFSVFFANDEKLHAVKNLQTEYWKEFFTHQRNTDYLEKRKVVGKTHARIGLPLSVYMAAMSISMNIWVDIMSEKDIRDENGFLISVGSLHKLIQLDTCIVTTTFSERINRLIEEQHNAMMEMSTPVTEIWQDILMLPIVGVIDSKRAQDIMTSVLNKIADTRARILILDIAGVAIVDTAVANHLIKVTKASALMGCQCIVSGVSPAIAQTIVELGIQVGDVRTTSTLGDALKAAFQDTGMILNRCPNSTV
ncbi:MAG: protoglobin domain-containing protein [Pseudomonadota bacterium]